LSTADPLPSSLSRYWASDRDETGELMHEQEILAEQAPPAAGPTTALTDPIAALEAYADLNPDVEILPNHEHPHRHRDAQDLERLRALGARVDFAEQDENLTGPTQRAEVVTGRVRAARRIATQPERGVER